LSIQGEIISKSLSINDICAVVVTYHPDPDFPGRVAIIAEQVGRVVIVDNGSDSLAVEMLYRISLQPNIHLILNHDNLGIATALNQGVRCAKHGGYAWALTFDQDTVAEAKMVDTLLGVYASFDQKSKLAVLGSNYWTENGRKPPFPEEINQYAWTEEIDVITSGSFISIAAFEVIGSFRDIFFIDRVDTEYCLRARSKGFKIILTQMPIMRHSIGASSTHRLLCKRTGTTNHSPLRRYYYARNLFILAREYWRAEPVWVRSRLYAWAKAIVLLCLFESDRLTKLKSIAAGVFDGLMFDLDDR
jgi:rhamnosyltransferase